MSKTAGNAFQWTTHPITVLGHGGFTVKSDNTVNAVGGELPLGQSFALFLDMAQTPVDVTGTGATAGIVKPFFKYEVAPLKRPLDHTHVVRIAGVGLQDFTLAGTYTGTTQKIYRIKVFADSGDPETIQYRISTDGGTTFAGWTGTADMTTSAATLNDGITIKFGKVTGHTVNDEWEFYTPMPQYAENPPFQTTGTGTNDLTAGITGTVTASFGQAFAIKIMTEGTGGSRDTYRYSTDGGTTYNNANINCSTSAAAIGFGITIIFANVTGHTANDVFEFHAFPTKTHSLFQTGASKLLVAWVENIGEAKVKYIKADSGSLTTTENTSLPAGVAFDSSGITLSSQIDTTTGQRIKLTPSSFNAYSSASTTDATYKWFSLETDEEQLAIGNPVASSGSPAGMNQSLRLHKYGIDLVRRPDKRLSSSLDFLHGAGGYAQAKMLLYDGKTDVNSVSTNMDSWFGSVVGGVVLSTWIASSDDVFTFHSAKAGKRWNPAQTGTYNSSDETSEANSTGTTLVDANSFDAGMVGRDIARVEADGTTLTYGIVTTVAGDGNSLTTSFDSWATGRVYKLPRYSNYFTHLFGKFAQGTAEFTDYKLPEISGTSYSHGSVHAIWSNIASIGFEGHAYKMWQRPSVDPWAVALHERNPANLGGFTEFGYTYNANSKGDSYKINWPHPDAEGSIAVGQVLKIKTYETANTAHYYAGTLGRSMGNLTEAMTNSQDFMLVENTAQASIGSSIIIKDQTASTVETGITVSSIPSSVRLQITRSAPQTVSIGGGLVRVAYVTALSIDGSKDRPYRMELEWADAASGRSEVDVMTDGFIYG